ncbi:MAG: toll/interleukin-1 receptor domain-containing protein [Methanobacterium sp.]|nr:toll/interleukin-1 receptor domain-containing protein [Methanobacterium sp.]
MESPKVFVSHAHEDKERFVSDFARKLNDKGIKVWIDEWEMAPGDSLVDKIFEEGIKDCDSFLIVLSKNSINKRWVKEELNSGVVKRIEKNTNLIPIIIDVDVEIPVSINNILRVEVKDLSNYDDELEKILMKLYGVSKKPELGQMPDYVVDYEVPGYTKLDSIVIKNIGDLLIEIENFNYILSVEDLLNRAEIISISQDQIEESLNILNNSGLIDLTITSGSLQHYFLQLTSNGFIAYAESFIEDFSQMKEKVVSAICNDEKRLNIDIASKTELKIAIVDFILKMFEELNYLEFAGHMGGLQSIDDITPTGKRHFRNIIS